MSSFIFDFESNDIHFYLLLTLKGILIGTIKAILKPKLPRNAFVTPVRYNEDPYHFYIGIPRLLIKLLPFYPIRTNYDLIYNV